MSTWRPGGHPALADEFPKSTTGSPGFKSREVCKEYVRVISMTFFQDEWRIHRRSDRFAAVYSLDSLPMLLALVLLNIVHPGRLMPGRNGEMPSKKQRKKGVRTKADLNDSVGNETK